MTVEGYKGGDLVLRCNVGAHFALLSAMPGRKRWEERSLVFESSGANLAHVLEHFPTAEWKGDAVRFRDRYLQLKMQEQNTRSDKQAKLTDQSGYEYKTKPFDHQSHAFVLSRELEAFALFHEQGCGKTKVIIDTAAYLYEGRRIDTVIVVAPNNVHRNWILNEIPAHLPDRIPFWSDYYSANKKPKELQALAEASKTKGMLRIIAFNVEGFTSDKARKLFKIWLASGSVLLVVDESSRIKTHSAKRTKFLLQHAKLARYRRIMTGTPVTKGAENLYSQFAFLDPRILGYDSFYTFRARYCIMGGFENRQIVAYRNVDELVKIIDGHSHRVLKAECLDLPAKIYKRYPFELSPEQRELYTAVKRASVDELTQLMGEEGGRKQAAELAIVRLLRLRQITCGWLPQQEPVRIPGTQPRMDTLRTIIEDTEGKSIIWACFRADLKELLQMFKGEAVGYWGETKERDRDIALDKFQNDPNCRLFIGHPKAAGIGLTLTAGETSNYYANDYDLELRMQSEDRNHRIGTINHIVYNDIEALKTIDHLIITALRKKKSLADQITQDPISIFMEESE